VPILAGLALLARSNVVRDYTGIAAEPAPR
jgi:hypothetical protein